MIEQTTLETILCGAVIVFIVGIWSVIIFQKHNTKKSREDFLPGSIDAMTNPASPYFKNKINCNNNIIPGSIDSFVNPSNPSYKVLNHN